MSDQFAAISDGDFLRILSAQTREQIPEVTKSYDEVLMMQAMAQRIDDIAAKLDAAGSTREEPNE